MSGSESPGYNPESLDTVCILWLLVYRSLVSLAVSRIHNELLRAAYVQQQEAKYFCRKRIMSDHYAISCTLACMKCDAMHLSRALCAPSPRAGGGGGAGGGEGEGGGGSRGSPGLFSHSRGAIVAAWP